MTNKEAWNLFGYPGKAHPSEKNGMKCITKTEYGWETPRKGWKTSTQWKIVVDDINKVIHIAFQYSKGKIDWLFNFIFPLLPLPYISKKIGNCRVHGGMGIKLSNIEPEINKVVYEYQRKKGYAIRLYGHSQGGGFAKVVHAYLRHSGYNVEKTITWGALRVFSWFSNISYFAKDIISYQHISDIVCHVPFVIMGFKGVGEKKIVGDKLWKWYDIFRPWKLYKKEYIAHTSYGEYE